MNFSEKKFVVTGGAGFLGRNVCKKLIEYGAKVENITVPRSAEHDLRNIEACRRLLNKGDIVIHLAARVGGLWAHVNRQAEFFYDNAIMALNIIHVANEVGIEKFVGLGTVCEYPDNISIPFKESELWSGYPSNITAPYGLGKKTMLVAGDAYRAQYGLNAIHLLLINLYGPGDDFDIKNSHAIPALIRRVREAKVGGKKYLEVWGDGTASREFLYVDDAADAIVLATAKYDKSEPVNIGSGKEIPIQVLAEMICRLMKFNGSIKWDKEKIGGQHRRQLDVSVSAREFNFIAKTSIEDGLQKTIDWYIKNY